MEILEKEASLLIGGFNGRVEREKEEIDNILEPLDGGIINSERGKLHDFGVKKRFEDN